MNCLFCQIINKEIPAHLIYEDDETIGMLDIHPVAPGHSMLIPRFHCQNILDLPEEKTGAVFAAVKKVTNLINRALNPDGFIIGINHGQVSGQAIEHLHIHIIPRFKGDGGGSIHSVVNNPPKESIDKIASKILNSKF